MGLSHCTVAVLLLDAAASQAVTFSLLFSSLLFNSIPSFFHLHPPHYLLSYKIPWIIWIQLLVTILFIILLFGISVCTSGSAASSASTSISASTSTGRASIAPPPPNLNNPSSSQRAKEEEIQRVEGNGEASGVMIIEDDQDRDESSLNDSVLFKHPTHPCQYLELAKQSFLKCFGLDTSSKSPSNEKRRKQD